MISAYDLVNDIYVSKFLVFIPVVWKFIHSLARVVCACVCVCVIVITHLYIKFNSNSYAPSQALSTHHEGNVFAQHIN